MSFGQKVEETKKKHRIEGDYIIYIGTIQPRKNLIRLMEAVARIDNLRLVVQGETVGLGTEILCKKCTENYPTLDL